jgi:hypothetical protein
VTLPNAWDVRNFNNERRFTRGGPPVRLCRDCVHIQTETDPDLFGFAGAGECSRCRGVFERLAPFDHMPGGDR